MVLDVQSAEYVLCMYYTVFNDITIEYKANCKHRNILYISHFTILTALLANVIFFPYRFLHSYSGHIRNSPKNLRVHNKTRWWDSVIP